MLPTWLVLTASFGYLAALFAVAHWADRRSDAGRSPLKNPLIYSLSLGVYATAWTFYGSVGRAANDGVGFLPIYLGPTLMIALWWLVLRKMLRISKAHRITSLADFIASRYGKSALLGGVVTLIAVVGILPYISLQLKAISTSLLILQGSHPRAGLSEPLFSDTAFFVAAVLAGFTIAFGTRHLDASEHHPGMVTAIAMESLVKLVAFIAVGVFVTYGMYDGMADIAARVAQRDDMRALLTPLAGPAGGYASWLWLTVLSMFAIVFLPRQFQMTVIENIDESHLKRAIWLFPLYMLAINLFVLPIAFGGRLYFAAGTVDADTYVLSLPLAANQPALALLVFVGGLSAATGMVIVEAIALSTMVCNDLLMPVLLRMPRLRLGSRPDLTALLLRIRRGAIVAILLLGYLYFRLAGEAYALVSIGLISFAAVAQFAPVALIGLYWKGATRQGALAGLTLGFAIWFWTLLVPAFARSDWVPIEVLTQGPFNIAALRPQQLFGLTGLDAITHAMLWSMLGNIGIFVAVSLAGTPDAADQRQARLFVDAMRPGDAAADVWRGTASLDRLFELATRFLGGPAAQSLFEAHARSCGQPWPAPGAAADGEWVRRVERQLAGAIGASSARIMMASTVQEEALTPQEMRRIVTEASQVVLTSHRLEQKQRELETTSAELQHANERLRELDRMKDDFVSTVSHELRTPLTSIRAFSEILRDKPQLGQAQRDEFLDIIIQESERLSRLIANILDLAKMESGRVDWNMPVLDLRDSMRQALHATAPLFADKRVQMKLELPARPAMVRVDPDRMVQVMVNLLSNAVKFVPTETGCVEVTLVAEQARVQVSVRDNGPGVRLQDQELIFEKFAQGGDTLTDRPAGTGLGLPISRQIVAHFGGRMWLESAPGEGASFHFELPAHEAGNGASSPA